MLVPKVISDMARDHAVKPIDVKVWVLATEYLDMVEFRQLKIESIANVGDVDASTVFRALRHLVRLGYLEQRRERRQAMYRVPLSRIYPRPDRQKAAPGDPQPMAS